MSQQVKDAFKEKKPEYFMTLENVPNYSRKFQFVEAGVLLRLVSYLSKINFSI